MKEIIIGRHGQQRTRITDPTVSREHCKVTINDNGSYTIKNLSQLGTKVDGVSIMQTTANLNSVIQLGPTFSATLGELIGNPNAARDNVNNAANRNAQGSAPANNQPRQTQEVKTYNIAHLQRVWDDFNNKNIEVAEKQRKINLTRTGLGIFTMCAMPTIFFLGPVGYVLTGIGVIGNIYSFAGMRSSESIVERQQRQEAFDDAWVCPNPDCGRSLLAKNYKKLVKDYHSCPYCKCKYVVR